MTHPPTPDARATCANLPNRGNDLAKIIRKYDETQLARFWSLWRAWSRKWNPSKREKKNALHRCAMQDPETTLNELSKAVNP